MTEFLWESGFVLFVAVLFGTPLIGLAWFIRRRRWWSAVVLGGAVVITPAHMMATAVGYGASWAFWLIIARLGWRGLVGVRPYR